MTKIIFILIATIMLTACEPIGPVPGTRLSGSVESIPANWESVDAETVQLETAVADKYYSVNVWGVGHGDYFYVASANGSESRWSKRIAKNNQVRLRVAESLFELSAIIVTDPVERDLVAQAFNDKYEMEASDDFPEVIVYRLVSD